MSTATRAQRGFDGLSDTHYGRSRPVLELEAVTKTYQSVPPVVALAAVSFTVRRGELVAIVGPSGSGKSTLLHVMGTLEQPSSGSVRIAGLDVAGLTDRELAARLPRQIDMLDGHVTRDTGGHPRDGASGTQGGPRDAVASSDPDAAIAP